MRDVLLFGSLLVLVACEPTKSVDDSGLEDSGMTDEGTDEEECPEPTAFDYADQAAWALDAPDCGGSSQSPINFELEDLSSGAVPDLAFSYGVTPVSIINNGHSVELEVEPDTASLTMDGKIWSLAQCHFHTPSEHTVQGESAREEMHLVHTDGAGGIAVVSFLLSTGDDGWSLPSSASVPLAPGECFASDETIDLDAFLQIAMVEPEALPAFYSGSLTTPPCTEGVAWVVFNWPLELSEDDFGQLETAYLGNNRDPQPLNERPIWVD